MMVNLDLDMILGGEPEDSMEVEDYFLYNKWGERFWECDSDASSSYDEDEEEEDEEE